MAVIENKEQIVDRISELLIEHFNTFTDEGEAISNFQKVVKDGIVQRGREVDERIVVYQSDLKANRDDLPLIDYLWNQFFSAGNLDSDAIQLITAGDGVNEGHNQYFSLIINNSVGGFQEVAFNDGDLENVLFTDNFSQFVDVDNTKVVIDPNKAKQILDTKIYELLPKVTSRQGEINKFFADYLKLTPPNTPVDGGAIFDGDGDGLTDSYNEELASQYSSLYDISGEQEDESDRYITWKETSEDDDNTNKSLEWLYKDLKDNYFPQETATAEINDTRPEYENISSGYLKIRHPNQAIIIRNAESNNIGLSTWEADGFTITMWVRFLNKVNSGTLFNYGNPFRVNDPHGFMLETFVLREGDVDGAPGDLFQDTEYERFARLVIREDSTTLRDSRMYRSDSTNNVLSIENMISTNDSRIYDFAHIPVDLTEWYFIVANYNVDIDEDNSYNNEYNSDPDFWKWNRNIDGSYTHYSGYGAKCKVEIISKSDLLRARGYATGL